MRTAVISRQGMRQSMEDAHAIRHDFVRPGWLFGGVYDGHAGSVAARYASEHLHRYLRSELESGSGLEQGFSGAFETVSRDLSDQTSGTTAAVFLIQDRVLGSANVGDARVLLIRDRETVQLSTDHRVDNKEERDRIERAGGRVEYPYSCKGSRCLMPTRVLGDSGMDEVGIIARPSIRLEARSKRDRMLVAGCDGIFDYMTNDEVASFALRYRDVENLVQALATEVLENRGGMDNLTILTVDLIE